MKACKLYFTQLVHLAKNAKMILKIFIDSAQNARK